MKRILTFQVQLVLSLLVGMGLSFISVRVFPPMIAQLPLIPSPGSPMPVVPPTSTGTLSPYVTLPGVWLVRVRFSSSEVPQVLKATYLEQGRITPFDRGDYRVELLNDASDVLFSGAFVVNFVQGDPPRAVKELTTILVLPAMDQAVQIRLKTPQGETTYDL